MAVDRRLSVAPMMDCTDRHARYLLRLVSRRTLLYTEMITSSALMHGGARRLLAHDPFEHPLALQIGGSDPEAMAASARLAEDLGYGEVNINVGCPSDRVRSGAFGACLMAEPDTVAACVRSMKAAVAIPVTVKTRTGIDDLDSYQHLHRFTATVVDAGCDALIVHARKAWLQGLSPKQNREIPPLDYARVYRLKRDWPALAVIINGGVSNLEDVKRHLQHVDGCMLGRAAYRDPWVLAAADQRLWQDDRCPGNRVALVRAYLPYVRTQWAAGLPLHHVTRHMSGLFQGCPGARAWRRTLSQGAAEGGGPEVIEQALQAVTHAAAAGVAAEAG